MAGRTVTLKVRFGDFATITRSRTVPGALDTAPALAAVAAALLDDVDIRTGVRPLGLSVANLTGADRQLALGESGAARGGASRAVDGVRARFGPAAVGPAALLGRNGVGVRPAGDHQWGPAVDEGG